MNIKILTAIFLVIGALVAEGGQVSAKDKKPSSKNLIINTKQVQPLPAAPIPAKSIQPEKPQLEVGDFTIDEIKAIVCGPVKDELITLSDIERRGFTGERDINLDKIVQERLADQRGEKMKYTISNEDIDKYLKSMAPNGEFERSQVELIAKQWGFTIDEFYDELKRLYRANGVMTHEMQAKMEVTDEEARKYWEANPQSIDGKFLLKIITVPKGVENPMEYAVKLPQEAWGDVIDVNFEDLPEDKNFVKSMALNSPRIYVDNNNIFVYKLVERIEPTVVPFDQRKEEIIRTLKEQKMRAAMAAREEQATDEAVFFPTSLDEIVKKQSQPSHKASAGTAA